MSTTLHLGDQSFEMPPPTFTWVAFLDGGDQIHENDGGTEKIFGDIPLDRLQRFMIKGNGKEYEINLKTGEAKLDGVVFRSRLIPGTDVLQDPYELIYFKRRLTHGTHQFQGTAEEYVVTETILQYVIGIKTRWTNALGKRKVYKQLYWIQEDGSVEISTE